MHINCISNKDFEETRSIHSVSNNIEVLMSSETDDIIDELFKSLLERYPKAREESNGRESEFIDENVDLLYYFLHKASLRRGESYTKSPKWLENKTATINQKNKKDDNCFQYTITLPLNLQNIQRDHQRMSKIKLFINQYNWKDIDFPSYKKDWKKFEKNNTIIALNILFVP